MNADRRRAGVGLEAAHICSTVCEVHVNVRDGVRKSDIGGKVECEGERALSISDCEGGA